MQGNPKDVAVCHLSFAGKCAITTTTKRSIDPSNVVIYIVRHVCVCEKVSTYLLFCGRLCKTNVKQTYRQDRILHTSCGAPPGRVGKEELESPVNVTASFSAWLASA